MSIPCAVGPAAGGSATGRFSLGACRSAAAASPRNSGFDAARDARLICRHTRGPRVADRASVEDSRSPGLCERLRADGPASLASRQRQAPPGPCQDLGRTQRAVPVPRQKQDPRHPAQCVSLVAKLTSEIGAPRWGGRESPRIRAEREIRTIYRGPGLYTSGRRRARRPNLDRRRGRGRARPRSTPS